MDTQPQQIHYTSKPPAIRAWRGTEPIATTKGGAGSRPRKGWSAERSCLQDLELPPGMWLSRGRGGLGFPSGAGQGRGQSGERLPRPSRIRASSAGPLRGSAAAPAAVGAGREPCQKYLNKQTQRDAIRLVPAGNPPGSSPRVSPGPCKRASSALAAAAAAAGAPGLVHRACSPPRSPV